MLELFSHFLFFLCAFVSIASAINLVFNPNPVYGALGMVGGFFVLSVIYILINQGFFASIQLLVYSGAIMVLFLFMIMLLNLKKDLHPMIIGTRQFLAIGVGLALAVKLILVLSNFNGNQSLTESALVKEMSEQGSLHFIGRILFEDYLLPFELISFLLLIAVVGAVLISKKKFPPQEN